MFKLEEQVMLFLLQIFLTYWKHMMCSFVRMFLLNMDLGNLISFKDLAVCFQTILNILYVINCSSKKEILTNTRYVIILNQNMAEK